MHEHNSCSHELKFCPHCNTVYCDKCSGEWKKPTMNPLQLPIAPMPNQIWAGNVDPTQPATIPIDISNIKKV